MRQAVAFLLAVMSSAAQQSGPFSAQVENPGTVFTVTTTLVQVDAVVTDGKGKHVKDLSADDFELLISGKPQKVTHFSYVALGKAATGAPAAPAPKKNALPPPPGRRLKAEDVRRTMVLMVDDLGLSFQSMAYVREAVKKFAREQMEAGDLVALCRTGSGMGAQQRFTSNAREILALADTLGWNPNGRYGATAIEEIGKHGQLAQGDGSDFAPNAPQLSARMPGGASQSRTVMYDLWRKNMAGIGTLAAVRYTVDALREMPGRKSIVLFSDGMQIFNPTQFASLHSGQGGMDSAASMVSNADLVDQMRRLIDRANRAGTVIYTVSAQGLVANQLEAQDRVGKGGSSVAQIGTGKDLEYNTMTQSLGYIADKTGGLAFESGNDLGYLVGKAVEDQQGYYLLAFQPESWVFEKKRGGEAYHSVQVKVKKAGLHVRTRSGFYGETDEATRPVYSTPLEKMRTAMLSPFESNQVKLRLTALYAQVPKKGAVVRNLLYVDANDLKWALAPDGFYHTNVSVVAQAVYGQSQELATEARTFEFKVAQGDFARVQKEGALYALDVPVKRGGPYQVRVAVRDTGTEKTGSASQFLEVPDLKKRPLALTSVVLKAAGAADESLTQVKRQFRRGAAVEYLCLLVEGAKAKAAEYQARVRLLRNGREVYNGAATITNVEGHRAVAGSLKLNTAMPTGEYLLQVVADGKGAMAEQWTEFEVVGDAS